MICVLHQPRLALRSNIAACMVRTEEMTSQVLHERMRSDDNFLLLDFRVEVDSEWRDNLSCAYQQIALADLASRVAQFDLTRAIVCVCHHGVLSRQAAALLRAHEIGRASCRERVEISVVAVSLK